MLSPQDGVVECTFARGKSVVFNMVEEIVHVIEVLHRRPCGFEAFHSVKLDVSERVRLCPSSSWHSEP